MTRIEKLQAAIARAKGKEKTKTFSAKLLEAEKLAYQMEDEFERYRDALQRYMDGTAAPELARVTLEKLPLE